MGNELEPLAREEYKGQLNAGKVLSLLNNLEKYTGFRTRDLSACKIYEGEIRPINARVDITDWKMLMLLKLFLNMLLELILEVLKQLEEY